MTPEIDLHAFASVKRECLGALQRLAAHARSRASAKGGSFFTNLADSLAERAALLDAEAIVFGIFGEFKRGKSTLLNALLGRQVSPVRVTPETAVLVEVRYGDPAGAEIEYRDGKRETVAIERLAEFTGQKANPNNEKGVVKAAVRVPDPYLKRGVIIVDTPGLQDVGRVYSNVAEEFVRKADAALLVLSYPAVSLSELNFLADAAAYLHKIFIIINLWPEYWKDRETIRAEAAERLADRAKRESHRTGTDWHADLTPERLRIHVVDAQTAYEARLNARTEELAATGMPSFEAEFEKFLTTGKGLVVLAAGLRCALANLSALLGFLELERAGLDADPAKLRETLGNLTEDRKTADAETAALLERITRECNQAAVDTARRRHEAVGAARTALEAELAPADPSPDGLRESAERHVAAFNRAFAEINGEVERVIGSLYKQVGEHLSRTLLEGFAAAGRPIVRWNSALQPLTVPRDAVELQAGLSSKIVQGGAMIAGGLTGGLGLAMLSVVFAPIAIPLGAIVGAFLGLLSGKPLSRFLFRDQAILSVRREIRARLNSLAKLEAEIDARSLEFFSGVAERLTVEVRNWVDVYFQRLDELVRGGGSAAARSDDRRRAELDAQVSELRADEDRLLELVEQVRQMSGVERDGLKPAG